MKHRVQSLFKKFRDVFSKKKAITLNGADDEGSTDRTPNETTGLAHGRSLSRSSSAKPASVKSKPSMSPEGAQAWKRSESFDRQEDKNLLGRVSESTSIPPIMPQLPTILVGEVMEPIALDTRKDSEHLPRDEHTFDQDIVPA